MQELYLLHLPPGGQRGGGGGLRGPGHGARVARSAGHRAGAALVLGPGAAAAGGLQQGDIVILLTEDMECWKTTTKSFLNL